MSPNKPHKLPPIPALLRAARGTYSVFIQRRLSEAGLGDLPKDGAYVVGGMSNHGISATQLLREMGMSQQAASKLMDTLVERGFLAYASKGAQNPYEALVVTDKGRSAAVVAKEAITAVDQELASMLSPEDFDAFLRGLVALIDIKERAEKC